MENENLVLDNIGLIHFTIKKLKLHWKTEDEHQAYIDAGIDGLIKGVKALPNKDVTSTYFVRCIENEIKHYLCYKTAERRCNPNGKDVSINWPISDEEEFGDFLVAPDNVEKEVIDKISEEELVNIIDSLPNEKDGIVLKMYYGLDGYEEKPSSTLIAKEFNVTNKAILFRLHRIKRRLKKKLIKKGYKEDLYGNR